jgi:LysM repeat protein
MDARRRRELTRYGAPAAFLAAATVAVLLIKAGLAGSGSSEPTATGGALPSVPTTTPPPPATRLTLTSTPAATTKTETTSTVAVGRFYTVESGDTLGGIAAKYRTTVDELLKLNPGIDPTALRVGQQIRVG